MSERLYYGGVMTRRLLSIALIYCRYTDHEVSNRFEGYEYFTLQPKITKPFLPESINREQPYLENNIESKVENGNQVICGKIFLG